MTKRPRVPRFAAPAVALAVTGQLGSALGPRSASADVLATREQIAFTRDRDDNMEIYLMNDDGSGQRNLTRSPADDESPSWSPDGRRIAFDRSTENAVDIYVMNADGTGRKRLVRRGYSPVWSPTTLQVAFFREDRDSAVELRDFGGLFVVNGNGSGLRRLAWDHGYQLSWLPDGRTIAYATRGGISVVNLVGSGRERRLAPGSGNIAPSWSPDGRRIVYERRVGFDSDIYVVNADGTARRRLARNAYGPAWSPTGQQILFGSNAGTRPEIHAIQENGAGRRRLTTAGYGPTWSSDGRRIAFRSARDGNLEIYVMNADGSAQRRVTRSAGDDTNPRWRP